MTVAVFANDVLDNPWRGTDRGATEEAQFIPRTVTAIHESLIELADRSGLRREGREALAEAFAECSVPDWDSYGALPADPLSASWAEEVASELLPILGLPHYSFDPEGEALLEWFKDADRVLDLSIGSNGELRYAATIGGAKVTGIEGFSDGLPPGLLSAARRLAVA